MTDADLLRGARCGDAQAWKTLYERYLPAVWRHAYARVSDIHAAEDITSETMLALLRNIDRLETEVPKIAAWLRSVVECKAADHYRKQFRTRDRMNGVAEHVAGRQESPSAAEPLEADEARGQVLKVLDRLPERQRAVLELKYLDALRVREIADRLGETEKAVEALLYRARREFRRLFELKHALETGTLGQTQSEVSISPGPLESNHHV